MSCKGCIKSGFCDLQMNGTTYDCPCNQCLVKMVCQVEICDELNKYYKDFFNFNHEDYKECINSD
jgi:hypothetical protein